MARTLAQMAFLAGQRSARKASTRVQVHYRSLGDRLCLRAHSEQERRFILREFERGYRAPLKH